MTITLHAVALILYVSAGAALGASFAGGRRVAPAWAAAILPLAVLAHGSALGTYAYGFRELPLVGISASLSTLAFLIGAYLAVLATVRDVRPLGLVLLPLIALLVGIALALGIRPAGEALAFRGIWFAAHVVLAFAGYAGLAVAFAAGLLYLLQFRELKGRRFGRIFRFFPPLATLDRVGRQALAIGFPALTLALLLAWAWTLRFQHEMTLANPQVVWGLASWAVFVLALIARARPAGGERRGALASVVGFLIVVALYVVLRLAVAEGQFFL